MWYDETSRAAIPKSPAHTEYLMNPTPTHPERTWTLALILGLVLTFLLLSTTKATAASAPLFFPVDPLPEDNLITNPWFRNPENPRKASLVGWTDLDGIWGTSRKDGNPTPDNEEGTGARFAQGSNPDGGNNGIPHGGVDGYIFTIVAADASQTGLRFQTHWVSANIEAADVTIYAGNSENGPWNKVWSPLEVTPEMDAHFVWQHTGMLEFQLERGYPFYRIEFHARYSPANNWGFKFTGVYFATTAGGAPTSPGDVTPEAVPAPCGRTRHP